LGKEREESFFHKGRKGENFLRLLSATVEVRKRTQRCIGHVERENQSAAEQDRDRFRMQKKKVSASLSKIPAGLLIGMMPA